jgi:hypothetical protein
MLVIVEHNIGAALAFVTSGPKMTGSRASVR